MYGTPRITVCLIRRSNYADWLSDPQSAATCAAEAIPCVRSGTTFMTIRLHTTFLFGFVLTTASRWFSFAYLSGSPVGKQGNADQCQSECANDPGQICNGNASGRVCSYRDNWLNRGSLIWVGERSGCPLIFQFEWKGIAHLEILSDDCASGKQSICSTCRIFKDRRGDQLSAISRDQNRYRKLLYVIIAEPLIFELAFVILTCERLIVFNTVRIVRFDIDGNDLPVPLYNRSIEFLVEEITVGLQCHRDQISTLGKA